MTRRALGIIHYIIIYLHKLCLIMLRGIHIVRTQHFSHFCPPPPPAIFIWVYIGKLAKFYPPPPLTLTAYVLNGCPLKPFITYFREMSVLIDALIYYHFIIILFFVVGVVLARILIGAY